MSAGKKTNAMRILEQRAVPFETREYEFEEEFSDAVTVAAKTNMPPEQVFKTIVMRNEHKNIFVFCVPANCEVNLKKARAVTHSKEIAPVKPVELLGLTGYIRGGCSPLGMKKKYTVFFDETAQLFDVIAVSAGVRGMQILCAAEKLAAAAGADFADITL